MSQLLKPGTISTTLKAKHVVDKENTLATVPEAAPMPPPVAPPRQARRSVSAAPVTVRGRTNGRVALGDVAPVVAPAAPPTKPDQRKRQRTTASSPPPPPAAAPVATVVSVEAAVTSTDDEIVDAIDDSLPFTQKVAASEKEYAELKAFAEKNCIFLDASKTTKSARDLQVCELWCPMCWPYNLASLPRDCTLVFAR